MMKNLPSRVQANRFRLVLLRRLQFSYWILTLILSSITLLIIAWHWHQPKPLAQGFSYALSIPILLIASFLINLLSFHFQNRYIRRVIQQPLFLSNFKIRPFAIRFYFYNLIIAIALSLLLYFPLLLLLFFYWIYPVIFWFIPYHLIIGFAIGWQINYFRVKNQKNNRARGEMKKEE